MNVDVINSVVKGRHAYPWPRVKEHELFHCRLGGKSLERAVMISKTPCGENYIGSVPHKYQHFFRELLESRKTRIICEITGGIETDKFQYEKGGGVNQACRYYIVRGIQFKERHGRSTQNQPDCNSDHSAMNREYYCSTVYNQHTDHILRKKPSMREAIAQLYRSDYSSSSDDSSSSEDENARKKSKENFSKPKKAAKNRSKSSYYVSANKTAPDLKIKKEPLSPVIESASVLNIKKEPPSSDSSSSSDDSSATEDEIVTQKSAGRISKVSTTGKKASGYQKTGKSSSAEDFSLENQRKKQFPKQDKKREDLKRKHESQKVNNKRPKTSTDVSDYSKQNRKLQNQGSQSGKSVAPSKYKQTFNTRKQKKRRWNNKSQARQEDKSVEHNGEKVILSKSQKRNLRRRNKNALKAADQHCSANHTANPAGQKDKKATAWQRHPNPKRTGIFEGGSISTVIKSIKVNG